MGRVRKFDYSRTVCIETGEGMSIRDQEFEIVSDEVEYSVKGYYLPGVSSGAVEDCYEDEGEFSLKVIGYDIKIIDENEDVVDIELTESEIRQYQQFVNEWVEAYEDRQSIEFD